MYSITEHQINFIKQFEGFSSNPYKCPAGLDTIGYGHVIKPHEGFSEINENQACELLEQDLLFARQAIIRHIHSPLNNHQFTAILSFTFNLGTAALQRSTLRQKINNYEHHLVKGELNKWIWCKGRILQGLIKRRFVEGLEYNFNA
ncbi:lysozyme [Rickettsiales endosymbiont of Stachyamoeba lipophora]|uniref:lysozyme n=1 Tax=Rickettsiales endosymbiont of Stachyamoeba lipophora TaxID=2486578 RepID=UPI000F64D1DF|nr:lysozyme [Rickettsiales endosymbiont of Stachyamoeba lipophora]AZL15535.1 lysozyme [Rickettsiales endosymbiont of Stachyamoeba lipophora]